MRFLVITCLVTACCVATEITHSSKGDTSIAENKTKPTAHAAPLSLKNVRENNQKELYNKHFSKLECIKAAYGTYISRIEHTPSTPDIVFVDGTRIPFDDKETKTFEALLARPDLEDQLSLTYPKGPLSSPPPQGYDPGRFRVASLFKAVYGRTKDEVRSRLESVIWLPKHYGKPLKFNKENGAAKALRLVSLDLDASLPEHLYPYIMPPSGTFNWRKIAGTNRQSPHSFGIAIDISTEHGDYWRWQKRKSPLIYRNKIPWKIVEVFEKHGFIWGGKWHHFDTLHFEYRPELFKSECTAR